MHGVHPAQAPHTVLLQSDRGARLAADCAFLLQLRRAPGEQVRLRLREAQDQLPEEGIRPAEPGEARRAGLQWPEQLFILVNVTKNL